MSISLKQVIAKLPLEQQEQIKQRSEEILKEYMLDTRAKVKIKTHNKELEFNLHPLDKKHFNKGNNAFWFEYIED